MKKTITPKMRPYWHVDAKWITAISLLFVLNITLFLYALRLITTPENGIAILIMTLASSYSAEGGGLDATADIDIMQQKISESPTGEWQPIPGMQIVVREEDISWKTPREARLWFFRQWAEPLYYDGAAGLANLMTDPDMQKGLEAGVGPLGYISADTHSKIQAAFTIFGLVSLLFLSLLVFFSYRFGRIGSPGCVIFITAIPGFLVLTGANSWIKQSSEIPTSIGENTLITRYTQLAADVLPLIVQSTIQVYKYLVIMGFGLVIISIFGMVFVREKKD